MEKAITLEKFCYVYLREGGGICKRLARGTRVIPIKRNGSGSRSPGGMERKRVGFSSVTLDQMLKVDGR